MFEAKLFSHKLFSTKTTNRCIFKTNFFFWRQFSDVEISSKQPLFHPVHFNHCAVNKFKMVLSWRQKISFLAVSFDVLSKIVFQEIFGNETCSNRETVIPRYSIKLVLLKIPHLCWSLFCNEDVGQTNLIEKETQVQMFSCELYEIFQNIYFIEYFRTNDSENIYVIFWKFIIKVLNF